MLVASERTAVEIAVSNYECHERQDRHRVANLRAQDWINARKEVLGDDQKLPEIYIERQHGEGYDFFPNCTRNAFEVATETLKDRVARYGAEDKNVRAWLTTQDLVFQNCSRGAHVPPELGAESPAWLRKDREYQIAAAYFYALKFDEARAETYIQSFLGSAGKFTPAKLQENEEENKP